MSLPPIPIVCRHARECSACGLIGKVALVVCRSFRRLFTHETWSRYTGLRAKDRWLRTLAQWRYSIVSIAILPCVAVVFLWSLLIATALPIIGVRRCLLQPPHKVLRCA